MSNRNNRLVAYLIVPLIFTLIGGALLFVGLLRPTEGIVRAYNELAGEVPPVFGEPDIQTIVNEDSINKPSHGAFYANMYCERFSYSGKIYYGISERMVKKGICQVNDTALIGFGGATVLYADNEGSFWVLEDMEQGDVIRIDTAYGVFEYEVTEAVVGYESDVVPGNNGEEVLIMYTEYPFKKQNKTVEAEETVDTDGTHKIVRAKKISGPIVERWEAQ